MYFNPYPILKSSAIVSVGSRGSVEPLDFEKTEMEHLNFLEFLEEKVCIT